MSASIAQPTLTEFAFNRDVAVVVVTGLCAGAAYCERLRAAIAEAVDDERSAVIIDLRAVDMVGPDVLGLIREMHASASAGGCELVVVRPATGPARNAFRMIADGLGPRAFATRTFATLTVMASRATTRLPNR